MNSGRQGHLLAGRYRLSTVIGRGGMGAVWRARDELFDRDVAVKEIIWPADFTEQQREAQCRRASREAQTAARISHPNVTRIYDIVEEDSCPWIVMELLPYRSLDDLVQEEGPLTPAQAAQVGLGILAALRAAHEQGIVHRDVKPANILVGSDRVVLTDWGIACAADSPALTSAGLVMGSPWYMAPERARGRRAGAPADLWGLGASLYAAVEGRPPFDRENAMASLTAVVTDEPEPATHAGPLWPVIRGLLRKDPDERLGAAHAERMLRHLGSPPARPAPAKVASTVARRPPRSRSRLAALAGSAALVIVAVSGTAVGLAVASSPGPGAIWGAAIPAAPSTPPTASTSSTPSAANARPAPGTQHAAHPKPASRPDVASARGWAGRHGQGKHDDQGDGQGDG